MEDVFIRLNNIMLEIGDTNYSNSQQTQELFNLNNLIYPDLKEYSTYCGACRGRVYNRLKRYWDHNKTKLN